MTVIGDARHHLAEVLTGYGVAVHEYPPASIAPPVAFLIPDSPYLSAWTLAGERTVGLQVQIVTAMKAPQSLDERLEAVLTALIAEGVEIGDISAPFPDSDTETLTARIPVTLYWEA